MQLRIPRTRQPARRLRSVAARASRDASRRAAAPIAGSLTPKDSSGVDMSLERPIPVEPFATPSGETINVLKHDYGFRTGGSRLYDEHYGEVPSNIFNLAIQNFREEWKAMRKMFVKDGQMEPASQPSTAPRKAAAWLGGRIAAGLRAADEVLVNANALQSVDELEFKEQTMTPKEVRARLQKLELNARRVRELEIERFKEEPPNAPWYIKVPYFALCWILDAVYEGRPIQRFWVLEEVARMPYFAYISMLHLYESLGWWRAGAALRRVHFAEEWNELHHLQIMESLGGDNAWIDRFVAQHSALVYYWGVMFLYALSPKNAYQFSELVEGHATDTYEVFAEHNRELLESIPPPRVAVEYYCGADQTMYQSFLVSPDAKCRQPTCGTMYEMFRNIIDDEVEHKKTMAACQDPAEVARQLSAAQDVSCDVDGKPIVE